MENITRNYCFTRTAGGYHNTNSFKRYKLGDILDSYVGLSQSECAKTIDDQFNVY